MIFLSMIALCNYIFTYNFTNILLYYNCYKLIQSILITKIKFKIIFNLTNKYAYIMTNFDVCE